MNLHFGYFSNRSTTFRFYSNEFHILYEIRSIFTVEVNKIHPPGMIKNPVDKEIQSVVPQILSFEAAIVRSLRLKLKQLMK